MKATTRFSLVVIGALCAAGFWGWPDWVERSAAQIKIVKEKAAKPAAKKNVDLPATASTPTPVPTITPILLPEIAAPSSAELTPGLIPPFVEFGMEKVEAEPAPPPPPVPMTAIGSFSFETLSYDKKGNRTMGKKTVTSYRENLGDGIGLELVEIPAGNFMMGASSNEGANEFERPQHKVSVPKFWLGKYEITQAQWMAVAKLPKVMKELKLNPSAFKGDDSLPVEQVSWDDAVEFCARLEMKTGKHYRLPTEAEWEYAARAGTTTLFAFGEIITTAIVNYNGNYPYLSPKGEYREKTVPVGSLGQANAFGLFDMSGNVWEWCQDRWHQNYKGAPTDGSAWETGNESRVIRGGSWMYDGTSCRSANRNTDYNHPLVRSKDQGFRVAIANVL